MVESCPTDRCFWDCLPGEWGVGVSRRTQKEGLFPWSYVEKHTAQTQVHQFELIKLDQPTMCWHTKEFIWGGGAESEAYRCKGRSSISPAVLNATAIVGVTVLIEGS